MVSSEVQRTLVKSPPELWAELSDPAALSRHLGELGEIRITRVEPEQAVEWQAAEISGTVLLKPSGWGTKVTLTVTRDGDAPDAPSAAVSPAETQAAVEDGPDGAVEVWTEPLLENTPEAAVEVGPEPLPGEDPQGIVEVWPESAVEQEPEDSAEAWRPATEGEPERAAETSGPESAAELSADHGHPPAPPETFEPELEPRRGFLARLFRRRPRPEPVEHESFETGAAIEPEPDRCEPIATWEHALEPSTMAARMGSPRRIGLAGSEAPGARDAPEPLGTPRTPEPVDPPAAPEPLEEAAAVEPFGQPPAPETFASPDTLEPLAIDAHTEHSDSDAADIAGELREAEEVTAEQATAVLTAVLDRLGAAHHRPFSRG